MLRRRDTDTHQRIGGQRQGRQHMGRHTLHSGPAVVRTVSDAFQQTDKEIQRVHDKQMDIPLVGGAHTAVLVATCACQRLEQRANGSMARGRLRGVLRYIRGLSAHHGGTESAAPDGCQHIQLRAADGSREREPAHRHGCAEDIAVRGHGTCVLRSMARDKVEVEKRYTQSREGKAGGREGEAGGRRDREMT